MTNPFKSVAPALGLRGLLFFLLGLVLLARTIPTFISMDGMPDFVAALVGAFLITVGVRDLIHAAQRMTRLRPDKLEFGPIDEVYGRGKSGKGIPSRLMSADENPNEAGQANLIEWIARVYPRLAYVPLPYTGALHAALIGFLLGVLGLAILVLLRVVLAGSMSPAQLSGIVDWYLAMYFVAGFIFWAAVGRFGFRRALRFEGNLNAGKMVMIFLGVLGVAIVLAIFMAGGSSVLMAPDLGSLPTLLVVGSLIVIASTMLIVRLRGSRAPDSYQASRGEELVTVAMHPTDLVNVIKSYTGKLGRGTIWHLGEWKPQFDEHERISAGHFDANLNVESGIQINESPPSRPESKIGMILVTLGLLLTTAAGFLLFRATSADLGSAAAVTDALRTPLALVIFGALFYRVGIIPMSELEWNSVIVKCIVNGTYQEQGSVTHLHAGDSTVRGSVLTRATVQPRCAYLKSVGFLRPGLASHRVPRLIDRVERADQVGNELLAAIHAHAREMMTTGTTSEPMKLTLPHEPTDARGDGDDRPEPPQPNTRH
jgi:hypothetical protein